MVKPEGVFVAMLTPFFVTVHLQVFHLPSTRHLKDEREGVRLVLFSKLTALSSPRKKSTGTSVWRKTDRAMINTGPK